METHGASTGDDPPTPQGAAAALESIEETQSAAAKITTPLWYFLALGAMIAPTGPLSTMTSSTLPGTLAFLGIMALWLFVLGWLMSRVVRSMGVQRRMTWRQAILFPAGGALAGIAAVVLKNQFDVEWAMTAFTVALGLVVVGYGLFHNYRKRH